MTVGLAGSRACDSTDAVPDVRPPDWLDRAAGALVGVERCRAAGVAPGGRGAAAAAPETEAGLGRPGGSRRPDPAAAQAAADEPPGHAGHAAALAPAAGLLAVDLSQPRRQAAGRCPGRGADRADGAGEPRLGVQADPRRTAQPRVPDRRVHGAAHPEAAAGTARAGPLPVHVAAVPPYAGRDHAGLRLLPVRHEALHDRVGVEGLHRWPVAAGR